MGIERAKEILEALSDGMDPITGEVLPVSDSCNKVDVVRALHTVLKYLDQPQERTKRSQPANTGKPWLKDDEEILCRMFDTGCTPKEICNHFQRSKGAIAARLGVWEKSMIGENFNNSGRN